MPVNSALEVAPHDDEFQRVVAQVLVQVETFFRCCIEKDKKDGSINRCQNASDMARTLLCTVLDIRELAHSRPKETF